MPQASSTAALSHAAAPRRRRLGVYDPLNLLAEPVEYPRRSYRRYVELEIKHGRIAMVRTTSGRICVI